MAQLFYYILYPHILKLILTFDIILLEYWEAGHGHHTLNHVTPFKNHVIFTLIHTFMPRASQHTL